MLTYQVRNRLFIFSSLPIPELPATVKLHFTIEPKQAFGMSASGGRSIVASTQPRVNFDMCSGRCDIENSTPLGELEMALSGKYKIAELSGNVLTIEDEFDSWQTVREHIEQIYYLLPLLLAPRFADPPYIDRVTGVCGERTFNWELRNWERSFQLTTKSLQEQSFAEAWSELTLQNTGRRLFAALSYFHTGSRLLRSAMTPGEFVGEAILNFCKTLQALFGEKRDKVREGLKSLGLTSDLIEGDILPLMLLRNALDVGHVSGKLLTEDEVLTLEYYVDQTESSLRNVLLLYLKKAQTSGGGDDESPPSGLPPEGKTALRKLKERMVAISQRGNSSERYISLRVRREGVAPNQPTAASGGLVKEGAKVP